MLFTFFFTFLQCLNIVELCKNFRSFTLYASESKVSLHAGLGACFQFLPYIHALVVKVKAVILQSQVIIDAVKVVVQSIKGMPVGKETMYSRL